MDPKQFENGLKDAETLLRKVRSLYDQWFAGIERAEPHVQRDELDRLLVRLKAGPPRNTALRFRLNQVSQQYQTYTTYWKRIARQIEEGTYQRDLLRARRMRDGGPPSLGPADRRTGTPATPDASGGVDVAVEFDGSLAPAAQGDASVRAAREAGTANSGADTGHAALRPPRVPGEISPFALPDGDAPPRPHSIVPSGAPPRTRSRPPPPLAPRPSQGAPAQEGGLPEAQMRALFDRYVEARRSNAERTDNVKLESLAKSVAEMLPKLREKHPGKKVGFAVVVKDGKVGLKPVTK